MSGKREPLTIGAFARAAGVNVETIRFYQRKGLLAEPDKPYGSIRRYGDTEVTRVRVAKSAQRLGFSLDEIAERLRLEDGTHCDERLAGWPNTSSGTCARSWRIWRGWRQHWPHRSAPAMRRAGTCPVR